MLVYSMRPILPITKARQIYHNKMHNKTTEQCLSWIQIQILNKILTDFNKTLKTSQEWKFVLASKN